MIQKTIVLLFTALMLFVFSASAQTNINLSTLTGNYTAQNGDVLIGSTSGTVTIANNAKITLSDATITYGIICEGNATITLVGTNNVSVPYLVDAYGLAGIQVGPANTTLTIRGNGSLNVDMSGSWGWGSAIGTRCTHYVVDDNHQFADQTGGNIVIEGGVITAKVKLGGAGIGTGAAEHDYPTGYSQSIGSITINGGSVTAIGGEKASGIGKGDVFYNCSSTVGAVTIYDNVDFVDASSISESVTYMHDETDVTANKADYFTIAEDGNRRVIVPKDDNDYTITIADGIEHGTLTGAVTAKYMEKVTITATPALGYRFSRLVVKDAQNNDVESTGNTFLMPKSNVTVSAVFEQGVHGTTEFKLRYSTEPSPEDQVYETIYDGLTTVNLQQGQSYKILKYDDEYSYRTFLLDNSPNVATIPYSGGTGTFPEFGNGTNFNVDYNGESGFYDITMTDVGNGKWNVSILKTAGQMDVVPDQTYTGSEIKPEPLVMAGSLNLTKSTDYEYSYTDNVNVGTAKVTVTFKGNYYGEIEKTFIINAKTLVASNVSDIAAQTYTGSAIEPEIICDGITLVKGTDYDVLYSDNTNVGTAKATITGKGNYTGSIEKNFTILPAPVTVTAENKSKTFGESDPEFTATVTGLVNNESPDLIKYTFSRTEGENVGEYTITPKGDEKQGNYVVSFVDATLTITQPEPDPDPQNPSTPISEITPNSGVKVWSYNHTIYIENAADTKYKIIDLQGRTITTSTAKSDREEVVVPNRNNSIAIVIINGKSFKLKI